MIDPKESSHLKIFKVYIPEWYGEFPLNTNAISAEGAGRGAVAFNDDGEFDLVNNALSVYVVDENGHRRSFSVNKIVHYEVEEIEE